MPLVLKGRVVPLRRNAPKQVFQGKVYVNDPDENGVATVAAVRKANQSAPAGFSSARVVDVGKRTIYPGLIDLHSHIAFNALPLWLAAETKPFLHHDIWPGRSDYKPNVSWPAWVLAKAAPEALLTYVQVRALAGGTTAIQGWPSANRNPRNQLVRNIDYQSFDGKDRTRTSVVTLDVDSLRQRAAQMDEGVSFIYHCAEGQVGSKALAEFDDVATANCLRQRLIAIHCTAIGAEEFARWRQRSEAANDEEPGAVVWSPLSNLWLYGETTQIPAALANGVKVCLGTDWGPSGTKNLLGELKVARRWSEHEAWDLSDFDLVQMVTSAPGDALALSWARPLGRLQTGSLADVTVVDSSHEDPWKNLVEAREENVALVLVNGQPRYGTQTLMRACGATRTTSVPIGRARRHVVLIDPATSNAEAPKPWTWSKTVAALNRVRKDPIKAVEAVNGPNAARGTTPSAAGPANDQLQLGLDMPGGLGEAAGPPPPGVRVKIAPFPSLRHDRTWRSAAKKGRFHLGVLGSLDQFFE
jgi:cytosine/adenosine deaminase-related metal-dependent hydrolase